MADTQGGYERLGAQAEAPRVVMNPLHQQHHPTAERKPRDKLKSTLYGLGIVEIVLGSVSVLLAVVTLIIAEAPSGDYWYGARLMTYPSQGLWGGLMLIITGLLGVKAKVNPSVCMYNANMVMSIITANVAGVVVILSGIASAISAYGGSNLVAIHAIIAVLAFTAFVICIIHSAYCCAGVCCRHKSSQGAVTYIPQQHYIVPPAQQMVQLPNGQFMMVPSQPMISPRYPGNAPTAVSSQVMFQPSQVGVGGPPMTLPPQAHMQQPAMAYAGAMPPQHTAQAVAKDQEAAGNPPQYRV